MDAAPGKKFPEAAINSVYAREGLGAAAFAAAFQALDVAAVFLEGIDRALFAGTARSTIARPSASDR